MIHGKLGRLTRSTPQVGEFRSGHVERVAPSALGRYMVPNPIIVVS